ncbi:MAG: LysE family translocator [Candidatus Dormibacteria bacterium]|jgi:threonine/homoserine/homoserine lactone efflux protein
MAGEGHRYPSVMDPGRTLAFAGVALLVILLPGPSVLFIVSRSLSLGRRLALMTVVGNECGELVQVCAVALGIGALVAVSDLAFTAVKLAGAAYLVFLGIQTVRGRRLLAGTATGSAAGTSRRRALWQAFVVGISNPKTMVFFAAVLPQFADRSLGHVPVQLLVLGLVWTVIALVCDTGWALAASSARAWLTGPRGRLGRLRWGSGAVMVGLGVGLAISGRPTSS